VKFDDKVIFLDENGQEDEALARILDRVAKPDYPKRPLYHNRSLELSRIEAILLIRSLSTQLAFNDPKDRAEFHPDEGGLFTVTVVPDP
jgi:hypothetical protein